MKIKFWGMMLLLIAMVACESETNYSQLLKAEEELIDSWLARNEIVLLDEFPIDTVFGANEMYHFEDGIYFQLIEKVLAIRCVREISWFCVIVNRHLMSILW
jgi:hypothetical protein